MKRGGPYEDGLVADAEAPVRCRMESCDRGPALR
jgi:hypothetical protein